LTQNTRYHLPEHLRGHIDYVTPGVKLTPVLKKLKKEKRASHLTKVKPNVEVVSSVLNDVSISAKAKSLSSDLQLCGYNMTPTCIKALYDIPDATKSNKGNSLGLYEQGDYFAKSDLDLFYKEYAPWVPQGTYPIPALIDGANFSVPASSSLNGGESDIDIDLA
jgi:tripeptidyl-peptidase-1